MTTVILCAAGSGTRAGFGQNKVLCEYNGLPVLSYSLCAFSPFADEILVACRQDDEARILPLLSPYPQTRTVRGGATRAESVLFSLREAKGETVLVHDAARPFVTEKIIRGCLESVKAYGSGVCAVPATDTVALAKDGNIYASLRREEAFSMQTPQGFGTKELLRAYEAAFAENRQFTDESAVYAAYIGQPRLCEGDRNNRKLTYPEDFAPAKLVGFGADTHAFAHQEEIDRGIARLNLNYIKLCGVTVPSDRAIEAHSDGDVPVHALMDALLCAIGERDIGHFFPDTDPFYKNADSMVLLGEVLDMVWGKSLGVGSVSISILCEKPRLAPYIGQMKENLRRALRCEHVGIAAGTNEKLGYIGEGRGITAYATVLLKEVSPRAASAAWSK